MPRTAELRIGRARRTAPTTSRPIRPHPQVTHLEDEEGRKHLILTVTCGLCMQQYTALGTHDGVYDADRQPNPHVCQDGR